MSSFCTTKSLGRSWLPSPVHSNKRARYGTWVQDPLSFSNEKPPKRWSKIHERFALLATVILLGICWCVFGHNGFLSNITAHLPWPIASSTNAMSHFAYMTYASNTSDLCSSLMQLESLHRVGARAKKVLLYPDAWTSPGDSIEAQLLLQAQEVYGALLQPVIVLQQNAHVAALAAYQTAYQRVIALDLDSTILRSMDELFFSELPERGGAGSTVMLSPSQSLAKAFEASDSLQDKVAKHSSQIPRTLQTSELRQTDHSAYLSSVPGDSSWSARTALLEANLVHFSDDPPWKPMLGGEKERLRPRCPNQEQCEERDVWQWLYQDFRMRRKTVCGVQFNEWEGQEAVEEADRRVIPLLDRVNGIGANSGAV